MRVIVADDQGEVRSAIKLILEEKCGLCVIGEAEDVIVLVKLLSELQPDLVILDWELGETEPGEAFTAIKNIYSELPVVVLSSHPQARNKALVAGARAFVCKSDPPESLVKVIEKIQST
jgi:two-component system, NarL family, invasion response regulator UvrY